MTDDAIIQEIRATREAFAAAHGYDIPAMVAALAATPTPPGFEVVRLPPRPTPPAAPPEAA